MLRSRNNKLVYCYLTNLIDVHRYAHESTLITKKALSPNWRCRALVPIKSVCSHSDLHWTSLCTASRPKKEKEKEKRDEHSILNQEYESADVRYMPDPSAWIKTLFYRYPSKPHPNSSEQNHFPWSVYHTPLHTRRCAKRRPSGHPSDGVHMKRTNKIDHTGEILNGMKCIENAVKLAQKVLI